MQTQAVRAVGIVEVARREYEVRPDLSEEVPHDQAVAVGELPPAAGTRVVERKVEEVQPLRDYPADARGCERLLAPDETLPVHDLGRLGERALRIVDGAERAQPFLIAGSRQARVADKAKGPSERLVGDGIGARDLVRDMDLVAVFRRRQRVPPIPMTSSSGCGDRTNTRFGNTLAEGARSGRTGASPGLVRLGSRPPGQPVIVCWSW